MSSLLRVVYFSEGSRFIAACRPYSHRRLCDSDAWCDLKRTFVLYYVDASRAGTACCVSLRAKDESLRLQAQHSSRKETQPKHATCTCRSAVCSLHQRQYGSPPVSLAIRLCRVIPSTSKAPKLVVATISPTLLTAHVRGRQLHPAILVYI